MLVFTPRARHDRLVNLHAKTFHKYWKNEVGEQRSETRSDLHVESRQHSFLLERVRDCAKKTFDVEVGVALQIWARGEDVNGVVGSTMKNNAGDVQFYCVFETVVDVLHPPRKAEAAHKRKSMRYKIRCFQLKNVFCVDCEQATSTVHDNKRSILNRKLT